MPEKENFDEIPVEPETEEQREARELQEAIDGGANESLESTRRMLNLCEESKEQGIKTLVLLDEQGEQLDRIEDGIENINKDMVTAEKNLEGLEKCCGLCVLPWKRTKKFNEAEFNQSWKGVDEPDGEGPRMLVGDAGPTGPLIARIQNDAKEDEMEENLQQVGSMVTNLRNMAVDMGNEIKNQNEAIDKITQGTASNQMRVEKVNERTRKML